MRIFDKNLKTMDKRILLALLLLLLLLLLGSGFWGFRQSQSKKALSMANTEMEKEIKGVETLKQDLSAEVETLRQSYQALAEENQILQGSLTYAESQLAGKDAEVRAAKKNAARQVNGLRGEIQALLATRSELEASISQLQAENDSLRTRTGVLERDLSAAREEKTALANLNQTMQGELKRLALADFKATAFQVEVETRRQSATAKSGKARRILVTFDLTGVAPENQGIRPLYLVVTNDKGVPISGSDIQAKSVVNGQSMDILAVRGKDVNLTANQRLSFNYDLEDKLKGGFYRVSVYTDIGLLGTASFRLQ